MRIFSDKWTYPGMAPPLGWPINFGSWQARGLNFLLPCNENGGSAVTEATTRKSGTGAGITWETRTRTGRRSPSIGSGSYTFSHTSRTNFTLTSPFTITTWVYTTSTTSTQTILSKLTTGRGVLFTLANSTDTNPNGLRLELIDSASISYFESQADTSDSVNTFVHVATTYDGVNASGILFYTNGESKSATVVPPFVSPSNIDNTADLTIASNISGGIFDFRIYNRVLTANEIRGIYRDPYGIFMRKGVILDNAPLVRPCYLSNLGVG